MNTENNLAFIDGQNMHFGTTKCTDCATKLGIELKKIKAADCICGYAWKVDLAKLRVYLKENYHVSEAYYFLGYIHTKNDDLYKNLQKAGFIVIFKEHAQKAKSAKRGNIDTDLVFEVMKNLLENPSFSKVLLISGDGDYHKLIHYLVTKGKFKKILFPNKAFASSLYKQMGSEGFDYLENIKTYINEKGS